MALKYKYTENLEILSVYNENQIQIKTHTHSYKGLHITFLLGNLIPFV